MNHVHPWSTDKNWQPGCISRSVLTRSRKAIFLCSCETTSQVLCPVLGSPATNDTGTLRGPSKGPQAGEMREWNTWCARRACKRIWGLSRLRRLRKDVTHLVQGYREDGFSLLGVTWWLAWSRWTQIEKWEIFQQAWRFFFYHDNGKTLEDITQEVYEVSTRISRHLKCNRGAEGLQCFFQSVRFNILWIYLALVKYFLALKTEKAMQIFTFYYIWQKQKCKMKS